MERGGKIHMKKVHHIENYQRNNILSAETLINSTFEDNKPIIENFLHKGLSLLCGKPKIGKSFFLLDMMISLSSGMPIFNWFETEKAYKTLYFSYEDNHNRLKKKLKLLTAEKTDIKNLYFSLTSPRINDGLEEYISSWLQENPDTQIIIFDTLSYITPTNTKHNGGYYSLYNNLKILKEICTNYNLSIILVHHTRKIQNEMDIFDEILGTTSLRGLVDTSYILASDYTLHIESRDFEGKQFQLTRQNNRFLIKSEINDENNQTEDKKYIDYIWEVGRPCALREIYEKFPDKNQSTIRNRLKKLIQDGRLAKPSRGEYEIGPYFDRHIW